MFYEVILCVRLQIYGHWYKIILFHNVVRVLLDVCYHDFSDNEIQIHHDYAYSNSSANIGILMATNKK